MMTYYTFPRKKIFFNFLKSLEYSSKTVYFKLIREKVKTHVHLRVKLSRVALESIET